jgi:hypothetical protein
MAKRKRDVDKAKVAADGGKYSKGDPKVALWSVLIGHPVCLDESLTVSVQHLVAARRLLDLPGWWETA